MQALLLLPLPGVAYNPFDLLLHSLHGARPTTAPFRGQAQANSTSRTKFQDPLILRLQSHPRAHDRAIDLGIKVVCIRILCDKLGDLDASDEILVRLSHEIVVPSLNKIR